MKQERIDRINTLYHKSQAVGLTEEEKKEQAALRKEYIESIRGNMRGQLNSILIKEKDGSITDLGKKYGGVTDTKRWLFIHLDRRYQNRRFAHMSFKNAGLCCQKNNNDGMRRC